MSRSSDDPRARLAKVLPLVKLRQARRTRRRSVWRRNGYWPKRALSWGDILRDSRQPRTPRTADQDVAHRPALELQERSGSLRPWERGFVGDLPNFHRISVKQRYILDQIAERVLGRGA